MTTIHGEGATIRSPITGSVFVTGPVANRADQFLTEQVVFRVRQDIAFKTVPARNAHSILNAVAEGKGRAWNRRMQFAETGRQLGADAIMVGHVYRFHERVGSNFAADSPASVAFDLYIIDKEKKFNLRIRSSYDNKNGYPSFISSVIDEPVRLHSGARNAGLEQRRPGRIQCHRQRKGRQRLVCTLR